MLLPAHEFVVFDEAHEVQDIFATLLGTSLSAGRMRALAGAAKPLLGVDFNEKCNDLVNTADRFANALQSQFDQQQIKGLGEVALIELQRCTELTSGIVEALRTLETGSADAEARKARTLGPAAHLANDLVRVNKVRAGELLYLTKRDREVSVEISLVDVGSRLREELWGNVTAVLTSATVPDTMARNLGLANDCKIEHFDSPFDYANHSLLYVPEGMPDRNSPEAESAIVDELIRLIRAAGGRTLALFTNRLVMERVAEKVAAHVSTEILVQGTLSRQRIIEEFRDSAEASLFAVTSFWQGVDVPGHSLSVVTIDRLPFSVPNDPLVEARRELSASPFMEVDLPRATMLLAQGVGRLIRSANDKGIVAVLDNRLAVARYKGVMFKKLPPMKRTRNFEEVEAFLEAI
jgi:ATP-dependent DNA helicase DinG